ncbi:MAG: 4Fe-4S dicluster domain-containing protein [Asgard group archaeon]|nr:4Fe-4S dicluster domain-containing protein [Asgard group archaeon]
MPYENCDECRKCFSCPVTSADREEGAYPIIQDTGDVWYCTSCFYCEDICPDYSPRKYAIDKRRIEECSTERMQDPIHQLKSYGTLFPISSDINSLRSDADLPIIPGPNLKEQEIIFNSILNPSEVAHKSLKKRKSDATPKYLCENNQEIALFLGCLIPYRVHSYEVSARAILKSLQINFCDLPFSCCGSVMAESHSKELWLVSAGYNLAIAEENGIKKILSLCGGCTGNLRRVNRLIQKDKELLDKVNSYLALIGKKYEGTIIVEHLTEFLLGKEQKVNIVKLLKKNRVELLQKLNVGVQIPCQVIRPKETSPNADLESKLLKDILEPTGIKIINYPFETLCCGSSMLQYDVPLALKIAKKRLDSLKKRSVDALIMACGNCSMNYTVHQSEYNKEILPTFFFSEIIAFALGLPNDELAILIKEKT